MNLSCVTARKQWLNNRYFGTGLVGVNWWNKSDIDIIDEGTPVANRTAGGSQDQVGRILRSRAHELRQVLATLFTVLGPLPCIYLEGSTNPSHA